MGKLMRTVKVQEVPGEPMRFFVESWERPNLPHVVDLAAERGHGGCDCRDYCTTVTRNRKAMPGKWVFYGEPGSPNPLRTQCRHIAIAQRKHLMTTLPAIARELYPNDFAGI
jgi:hypothetical protein